MSPQQLFTLSLFPLRNFIVGLNRSHYVNRQCIHRLHLLSHNASKIQPPHLCSDKMRCLAAWVKVMNISTHYSHSLVSVLKRLGRTAMAQLQRKTPPYESRTPESISRAGFNTTHFCLWKLFCFEDNLNEMDINRYIFLYIKQMQQNTSVEEHSLTICSFLNIKRTKQITDLTPWHLSPQSNMFMCQFQPTSVLSHSYQNRGEWSLMCFLRDI